MFITKKYLNNKLYNILVKRGIQKIAYRGPGLQYKIRKGTINNRTGDSYVITVPRIIAEQFSGCFLRICVNNNVITMQSGCKIMASDIDENQWGGQFGMRKVYDKDGRLHLIK